VADPVLDGELDGARTSRRSNGDRALHTGTSPPGPAQIRTRRANSAKLVENHRNRLAAGGSWVKTLGGTRVFTHVRVLR